MKLKYFLLSALLLPAFSQAQSTLVGLTHGVYADSAFVSVDTSWLSYSNGRGSDVKINMPFYPSLLATPTGSDGRYDYDVWGTAVYDSANAMTMTGVHTKTYDSANGNRLLMDVFSQPDSSGWMDVSMVSYEYDSMGTLIAQVSHIAGNTWINNMRQEYTYDPAHNITSITMMMWDGSTWVNTSKNVYYYNFLNKVTSSLVQVWNANTWNNSEHYIYYSHDNNVTVDSVYYQQMVMPNWVTITKDRFATDGNGDVVASWHYMNDNLMYADSNVYDGMHNKLTQKHSVWDSAANALVNVKQYSWAYNTDNQPLTYLSASWDSSGLWVFNNTDNITTYYYAHDSATRVANVSNLNNLQLYPVPAQNVLNINMTWNAPQAFTVAIIDVQGRVLRQWNESATGNYSKSIPVADLATGNYFLAIKNGTTNTARQFTVAH